MRMKQIKRWTSLTCVPILAFLAACGGGNGTATEPSPATNGGQEQPAAEPTPTIKVYTSDLAKVTPSDPASDPSVQYMMEKSGVNLDITFVAQANYNDQMRLKFAASDFPDLFQGTGLEAGAGAIAKDLLLPLNDLIEEHGPNLKANIPQSAWDGVTVNGEILGVPAPAKAGSSRILFIREDWLKKLNLDYPTTSDEYLDVLRAFRDNDLNGNGEKDEIPFTTRQGFNWVMHPIFGMWGLTPYSGFENEGEIVPGFAHPRFKQPLAFLQTMYKEGLLDSEFLTNSSSIWAQKFESGRVGSFGYMPDGGWAFHKRIVDATPDQGVNMMTMPTPRGSGWDGPVGSDIATVGTTYHVLESSQNPVAAIKFLNWLLSEEGQVFSELGLEGLNYKIENGKIVYDEASEEAAQTLWRASFKMHGINDTAFEARYPGEAGEKLRRAYEISHREGFTSAVAGMPPLDEEMQNLLLNSFQETAAEVVVNNLPVDETWDAFVEKWRSQGGNELIKIMTDYYNANK